MLSQMANQLTAMKAVIYTSAISTDDPVFRDAILSEMNIVFQAGYSYTCLLVVNIKRQIQKLGAD